MRNPGSAGEVPDFYYSYKVAPRYWAALLSKFVALTEGNPAGIFEPPVGDRLEQIIPWEEASPDQSILSQRRDPRAYPELWGANWTFSRIRFYREIGLEARCPGPASAEAGPPAGIPYGRRFEPECGTERPAQPARRKGAYSGAHEGLLPSFRDVMATVVGGAVQIFFHEKGLRHPVPANRLSDGSLRYLCLLAVLCNPNATGVVCIEEPELGLHPDIIPEVAKLLVEASSKSQIFVTTHSDVLVDALTETPEAVIVCEKEEGATRMRRLDSEELKPWLEEYRLGEMWTRGEIGGNRW